MRNITAAIAAAEAALAESEARAAALEAERIAMLENDTDYVVTASAKAREIETLRETAEAHRARISVLLEKQKHAEHDERERQRIKGIAAIKKRLPMRLDAAKRLDRALINLSEAIVAFEKADRAVFHGWPSELPPAHSLRYCSALTGEAFSTVRKERAAAPGILRALVEKLGLPLLQFAAQAERGNADLIEELERSPLVEREEAA